GVYVAQDPSGAAAVSAIRVAAPDSAGATLTLNVADGGAGTPDLVACPISSAWKAAQGGKWEDAPVANCDLIHVEGMVSDDAKSVTFTIPPEVADAESVYDIGIVPATDAQPFSTPFESPKDAFVPTPGTSS